MTLRNNFPSFFILYLALLSAMTLGIDPASAQPPADPPNRVELTVGVVGGIPPTPIPNALVLVKPVPDDGTEQLRRGTDQLGLAPFAKLQAGIYRIQVSAEGWRIVGDDYKLQKPKEEIKIDLKME